jgi:hypothetical protein
MHPSRRTIVKIKQARITGIDPDDFVTALRRLLLPIAIRVGSDAENDNDNGKEKLSS